MASLADAFDAAEPRPSDELPPDGLSDKAKEAARAEKKNYAQHLSEAIAVFLAEQLRPAFPEVLPRADGTGQESRARTGKGIKKLDVNYSTPQLGLGLGISIKTLNFRDGKTKRYTKNPTRLDNELRAEAMDYHQRQPYAVLCAIVYVPLDACDDGNPRRQKQSWSSFAQIVNVLRHRAGRRKPTDDLQLFERVFVGLYEHKDGNRGRAYYFDAETKVPQFGRPDAASLMNQEQLLARVVTVYDERNTVRPAWSGDDVGFVPMKELIEQELVPQDEDEEAEEG